MAHALYTNNATATLAAGISNSATTITLNSGQGSLFPSPTAGNYFYGTLTDAATGTLIEIVKVTSRTTDSMVVARGQQGTTAQAYNANDKFELRVTAGGLSELASPDAITMTGTLTLSSNAVNPLEAVPKQQLDAALSGVAVMPGMFKNLQVSATGLSVSVSVSYDALMLADGSGAYLTDLAASGTINTAATGAGGLDTGTLATSTWYSVWRIAKTDGTKSWLISLSATSPTMPSGYTLKARIGWIRTDSTANKYPLGFTQRGRRVQYLVAAGSNVTAAPQMASISATTMTAISISSYVPTTASIIDITMAASASNAALVAPNSAWSTTLSGPTPQTTNADTVAHTTNTIKVSVLLEGANIYGAVSGGTGAFYCMGWEDNL